MSQQKIKQKEERLFQLEKEYERTYNQLMDMRQHEMIIISDHAISRFIERSALVNMKWVRSQLLTPQVLEWYQKLGNGTYPTGAGNLKVVIKNGVIVTVLN